MPTKLTRRNALKLTGAAAGALALPPTAPAVIRAAPARQDVHEIVHWSWLTASDGEVWQRMIDAFNEAHADQGVQIRMEVVPDDQYQFWPQLLLWEVLKGPEVLVPSLTPETAAPVSPLTTLNVWVEVSGQIVRVMVDPGIGLTGSVR